MVEHFVNDVNTQVIMVKVDIHMQVLVMEQDLIIHRVACMVHTLIVATAQVLFMAQIIMALILG